MSKHNFIILATFPQIQPNTSHVMACSWVVSCSGQSRSSWSAWRTSPMFLHYSKHACCMYNELRMPVSKILLRKISPCQYNFCSKTSSEFLYFSVRRFRRNFVLVVSSLNRNHWCSLVDTPRRVRSHPRSFPDASRDQDTQKKEMENGTENRISTK